MIVKPITKISIIILLVTVLATLVPSQANLTYAQEMVKEVGFPNKDKAKSEEPVTLGTAACLIDAKTGHVIYGVDEHEQNYPASTTKILTALLTIENLDLEDEVIVDAEAEEQGGSQLYLKNGENISIKDLLYGLMLPSANDAAIVLGKAMQPTTAEFAEMMNERAKEAGAKNSNFANPNGLPDDNHYTTAYDLAMIAKDAMEYDEFRECVSTYEYTIPKSNLSKKQLIHNRNRLLYNVNRKVEVYGETKSIKYDGVTGIKTGYTDKSKFCLVGSAERNGTELIAVTMKTEDMNGYQDVISMLDYGFNNYETVELKKEGEKIDDVEVNGGTDKNAKAAVSQGLYATLPIGVDEDEITLEEKYKKLTAPYDKGENAGTIEAYYQGEKIGETKVVTTEGMEEGSFFHDIKTGSGVFGFLGKILVGIILLAVLLLVVRIINKSRQQRLRRKRRRERYR